MIPDYASLLLLELLVSMDTSACIDPHNRIVKYAIDKVSPFRHVPVTRGYFNHYGPNDTNSLGEELSEDVITFLEGIDIVPFDDLPFLPILQGIALPSDTKLDVDPLNIITLYSPIHAEYDDVV
jgi:hypothetical protein